jgi:aspartyl-tRNA(Asn)/glutamyl-tRNA(Gln) amidotransferase subunit A
LTLFEEGEVKTIAEIRSALSKGETTSEALTAEALERARDPAGEGARAFINLYEDKAPAMARASDALRAAGVAQGPLAGVPISIKDLFDVEGEVTRGGSVVLDQAPPADADAVVIQRLKAAGAVFVGRTNMVEFAYSGVGLNPHYGTPKNPYDRATGRIPGGSTSGGAVSVTDGMAVATIGSDTGGSVRIPAGYCGLAGFKPTARRVSLEGVQPLSFSFDSVGPLAPSVACCALLDAVLAGEPARVPAPAAIQGLRLGVPTDVVLGGLDDTVALAFGRALDTLSAAGAQIRETPLPQAAEIATLNAKGGFPAAEAYAWHKDMLARDLDRYDPRVGNRILKGADMSAADYLEICEMRRRMIEEASAISRAFDALVMPTVATVAPPIADCAASEEAYTKANLLALRNTMVGNVLDRCAVTIPCHAPDEGPVGLMLMGEPMADKAILAIGMAVEAVLRG